MKHEHKPDQLAKYALLSMTGLGVGLIAVVVMSTISENLKMALCVAPLSTIIGSIATLLNLSKPESKPPNNIGGDQLNVNPVANPDEKE